MNRFLVALAVAALPLAGACSNENAAGGSSAATGAARSGGIGEQLSKSANHKMLLAGLNDTGLGGVFAGKDSYTLLAPNDAAFARLGAAAPPAGKDGKAAMAALLRDHMVPGFVTPADIGAAIDKAKDGTVKMRTMGAGEVTFAKDGAAIVVTASDGTSARITGEPMLAGDSAAIPIDGLLKKA